MTAARRSSASSASAVDPKMTGANVEMLLAQVFTLRDGLESRNGDVRRSGPRGPQSRWGWED